MSLSNNPKVYEDVRVLFERALLADRGVMVTRPTNGAAIHLRQRCYKFRVLDRLANEMLYPEGAPLHGKSAYDLLTIDCVENIVYIKKYAPEMFEVKDIPEELVL